LSWRDHWVAESAADWAVTDSDRVVGHVGFRRIDHAGARAGISYWTVPAARGRGVAARAAVAASRWMFDQVGLHRIELRHSVLNEASCRVAAKAGFVAEGVLRSAGLHADGWHDMHAHARIADD
jgi:RimJ/RimL family protein N-acetyltransferase